MKICCTSDLHGHLPDIPDCELLLLAGDYIPFTRGQFWWLRDQFMPWLYEITLRGIKIIGIAGNHDRIFANDPSAVPKLPWTYLQDSGCNFKDLNIWGTPWQPVYHNWAFNLPEEDLHNMWRHIPENTDILIVHGPPHGVSDYVPRDNQNVGSPSLRARIQAIKPSLVVTGHIHEGYGVYLLDNNIPVVNASHMTGEMQPINKPIMIDF